MTVRGPTEQDRVITLGRTGSGKSVFDIDLLASRNWDEMPWVFIDYKGEDLFYKIMVATGSHKTSLKGGAIKLISPEDQPPCKPGLYYMQPRIGVDDDAINSFLFRCYDERRGLLGKPKRRGHIGLMFDEGYALPSKAKGPFDQILVQGRSLYIPVLALFQRPAWMSRFAIAQANFFSIFDQTDDRDWETIRNFVRSPPNDGRRIEEIFATLPPYYSLWYDVSRGVSTILKPASPEQLIINKFINRLKYTRHQASNDGIYSEPQQRRVLV